MQAGLGLASGSLAGITVPRSHLHCDSRPVKGAGNVPYFVWFAAFNTPADGCEYFLHLLCGKPETPKRARTVLEMGGTEQELAAAMYASGYYTGFRDPSTPEGRQANIDAYASSLRAITPSLRFALADWTPPPEVTADTEPAPPTEPNAAPLPLDVDWDEQRQARDEFIRDKDES